MIRLIFLKVVTQSWLRNELTPEFGSSDHSMFRNKIWMWFVDEDEEEKVKEWHLDVEEDNIQDVINIKYE
jgi:hypothetical protein